MRSENIIDPEKTELVIEKLNDNSVNEPKFNVDMEKNCNNEANPIPMIPPNKAVIIDSIKNAVKIELLPNPNARSVPISVVRFATAAYIVIMAPIIAPRLKITVMVIPKI